MNRALSSELFQASSKLIPGGVNSPVRAFKGVGGEPILFASGKGSHIVDVDGNNYIDYVGSWGTGILGHAHPEVVSAVKKAAALGLSFGAPTRGELEMAYLLTSALPSMEKIRLVSSGTEACMSAVRLARGYTKRKKIVKFSGNYHGHGDSLLVKAGSGVATFGLPQSPGVLEELAQYTCVLPYNDTAAWQEWMSLHGHDLACVIVEPILGNSGFIPPVPGFLQSLRDETQKAEALLIFDEVMTGFRVAWGGYQKLVNISPDLTTLGKVIGGGLPLAAFGGRAEIMDHLAPLGPVYQAGTLSGNPVAVAAGIATLQALKRPGVYEQLAEKTDRLVLGFRKLIEKRDLPIQANGQCGMFGLFFSRNTIHSFEEALGCNIENFRVFFHRMLDKGIYLAPSAFEAGFMSLAHTEEDIDQTLNQANETLSDMFDA